MTPILIISGSSNQIDESVWFDERGEALAAELFDFVVLAGSSNATQLVKLSEPFDQVSYAVEPSPQRAAGRVALAPLSLGNRSMKFTAEENAILAIELVALFQRWVDCRDGDNAIAEMSKEALLIIRPHIRKAGAKPT